MKIYFAFIIYIQIFILVIIPVLSTAQSDRTGNHCAVQKSPYRVSMDSGKIVYSTQCLSCHQANGMGIAGVNPPLNGKPVTGDKAKLIGIITNGRSPNQATNDRLNKNTMHSNTEMEDQEIAYVLTFIRNSFGNKASSVKVSEIKSARKKLN
jgi:mono/diheme cytochrome c family protein